MHFGKYLKTAFLNHWNLLVFLAGMAFALLSGSRDVLLPLVLAGEIAYVGLLGSHPKFQSYVDAQEAKAQRDQSVQAKPADPRTTSSASCRAELLAAFRGPARPVHRAAPHRPGAEASRHRAPPTRRWRNSS